MVLEESRDHEVDNPGDFKDIEGKGYEVENPKDFKDSESDDGIVLLDDPSLFPEGGLRAYTVVVGAFIGFIGTLGFVNSLGVLQTYITTNILISTSESKIGWIFSIYGFLSFGLTLILGPVFDRLGCKIPLFVGLIMQTTGFMCMSLSTELYQFILSFSILGGLGTSLTFAPLLGCISHWFYRNRAQVVGLAYVGGAIGGIIFPLLFRSLLPKVGFGWTIRIGAFMVFAFLLTGFLLVADRKEIIQKAHVKNKEDDEPIQKEKITSEILKSIDFRVFKDPIYSGLVLALLFNGFAFLITLTYMPSYAVANRAHQNSSYLLLVVFNSMSIPGRIIPGIIADRYGRFNTLCIIATTSTIAFCIIWLPPPIGHKTVSIYIFAGVYGFTSGSVLSLTPACIGQICKTKDFGKRAGTAFFILSFGDLFGVPIGGAIIGKNELVLGFDHLVIFISVLSFLGAVSAYVSRYLYKGFRLVKV